MEGLTEFVSKSFVKDSLPNFKETTAAFPCKLEAGYDSSSEPTDLRIRRRSESPETKTSTNEEQERSTPTTKTETIECSDESDNGT